jgi:hypothetical protein
MKEGFNWFLTSQIFSDDASKGEYALLQRGDEKNDRTSYKRLLSRFRASNEK